MARPKKRIPANAKRQIEELAATGASLVEIANALGIGKDLLRQWVAEHQHLAIALTRGRERERQALHGRLFRSAMEGNVVAAIYLTKVRHGYDDRAGAKESVSPEELARDIRAALGAMREATAGK
jgi:transposase-like protein